MKKIFLVGGGTGGHLFPAIATSQELSRRGNKVSLITDDRCLKYLGKYKSLHTHIINSAGLRSGIIGKIIAAFKVVKAVAVTFVLFIKEKPDLVITFGGYVSFAPLLCANILGVTTIIHEQNCFLGKVNKWFAKKAAKILLTFKNTKNLPSVNSEKIIITGNPVRDEIENIKIKKNFASNPFKIVIVGGSQGAKIFSHLVPKAIEIIISKQPDCKIEITQQAKIEDKDQIQSIYKKCQLKHEISDFFYNIPEIMSQAHLVIARSGASTIAELIALEQPAIFVPYPFAAEKHQHFNAEIIAKNGGGWWIDQNIISAENLADKILEVVNDRNILAKAAVNLKLLKIDSVNIIANAAEKIIASCKK